MPERIDAVTFTNRDGLRLVGMYHTPTGPTRRDVAVVLLSPGVKTRVAPHRLYNKLAASLTAQGLCVFRFDFYGLGDAEGEVPLRQLRDLYGSVALGRYVHDTQDALEWLATTHGFRRFIVGGLCGGALTGLLTAPRDPRIAGIIALGLPVLLDSANLDPREFMTVGQLTSLRSRYFEKALNPKMWLRVVSGKTDFRLLFKALGTLVKKRTSAPATPAPSPAASPAAPSAPAGGNGAAPAGALPANMNPHFAPAFFTVAEQGRPMLLVFSQADRLYWEFDEKFVQVNRARFDACAAALDLHVIPSANHVLTFEPWQIEAQAHLRTWLETRFPVRS